jgi:hypothetical protein
MGVLRDDDREPAMGADMALVSAIEPSPKERQGLHKPTRCLYSVVQTDSGERLLQLDTYGSEEREHPEKISQSLQFDRAGASQLFQLLKDTFPGLI